MWCPAHTQPSTSPQYPPYTQRSVHTPDEARRSRWAKTTAAAGRAKVLGLEGAERARGGGAVTGDTAPRALLRAWPCVGYQGHAGTQTPTHMMVTGPRVRI